MEELSDLKEIVNKYSAWIPRLGIILIILSTFFVFTNLFTEFFDTPKFLVLLIITGILLVLFTLKASINNKIVFVRTPLDIPLLLLLAVSIVSTVLSGSPFVSLLGNQLKVHGSLASLAVYVIFYFVLTNSLKSLKEIKGIIFIVTIAGVLLSLITLLTYSGLKILPPPWTHGINFTPTGSSFSTTAILAILIPFVTSVWISSSGVVLQVTYSVFLLLFGLTIALTGTGATWIAALLGFTLTLLNHRLEIKRLILSLSNINEVKPAKLISLIIPLVLVLLVVILSFIPPLNRVTNPLYNQAKSFPKELQLPFITSWKVAISSFRDAPFWGTGPATFLFNFTQYKPIEFNSSKNWNVRFDTSFNEYLRILSELGGIGLIALLSLTALFISAAYPSLVSSENEKRSLAIAGILFFIILALHSSTLVFWVFGLVILASFMVLNLSSETHRSWDSADIKQTIFNIASQVSSVTSSEKIIRVEALPTILLSISLALVLFTFFFASKFAVADFHHRAALNGLSQNNGILAYNELVASEKLNPVADLYRIDLAQTNFALANAIAAAKGPTQASESGSLTDQDKQNIQVLLQQSINEGRAATALSPRSPINWEILALLYRQIAGVAQNALVFSLDSYGKAIFQDPLNPNLRLSVGGVYYVVKNYDLAIRFFTDAINLKGDFANGYYNLSVALKDKGDLANAQAAAEKVLTLVEKDSQDYKVAQSYLDDLKSKTGQKTEEPPAAQTTGSLQKKELPKVVNVGNPPEKIATPPAVKKPNATPEPTPQP